MLTTLNIPMDTKAIEIYKAASEEAQERINQVIRSIVVRANKITTREQMLARMRDMGETAQANGLTPELLAEILAEIDAERSE